MNLKKSFNLDIPDYEEGKYPFEDPENTRHKGTQYLQSKYLS